MTSRRILIPVYLFLCLLLGGASLGGYLSNMVLQLLALPIILFSLLAERKSPNSLQTRSLLILFAALVMLLVLQLVPLPPAIWTALPGRERVVEGYELLGVSLPWLPLTLAPARALATLLWMLPATAVLLGITLLGAFRTRWIAWAVVAATILSIVVGGAQVADDGSPFYFYQVTNTGLAVGFFANANHQATLLLATGPLLVALFLSFQSGGGSIHKTSGRALAFGAGLGIVGIGLAINTSLAGIGLAVPVAWACWLMTSRRRRKTKLKWAALGLGFLTVASVAAIFSAPFMNGGGSAERRGSVETRSTSIQTTARAAIDHLPLGAGLGSFEEVYRTYEDPARVDRAWMNHAHSDFTELFLELGLPGLVLVGLFLLWWVRRSIAIWASGEDHFARAATIASGAILAHSMVDYPLRTVAIGAVFAACCALMANPRERSSRKQAQADSDGPRHLSA